MTEGIVIDVVLTRTGLSTVKHITVELATGGRAGVDVKEAYGKSYQIAKGDTLSWDEKVVKWTPPFSAIQVRKDVLIDRYVPPTVVQRKKRAHKRVLAGAK